MKTGYKSLPLFIWHSSREDSLINEKKICRQKVKESTAEKENVSRSVHEVLRRKRDTVAVLSRVGCIDFSEMTTSELTWKRWDQDSSIQNLRTSLISLRLKLKFQGLKGCVCAGSSPFKILFSSLGFATLPPSPTYTPGSTLACCDFSSTVVPPYLQRIRSKAPMDAWNWTVPNPVYTMFFSIHRHLR